MNYARMTKAELLGLVRDLKRDKESWRRRGFDNANYAHQPGMIDYNRMAIEEHEKDIAEIDSAIRRCAR